MLDVLFLILVILVILVLWQMIYDTNRFVVRNYTVEDPRIRREFRAVMLADLHNKSFGRENAALLQVIDEQKPDIILVAGDMLTAKPGKDPKVAIDFMRSLSGKYPIYYGSGNHEYRAGIYPDKYGDLYPKYHRALMEMGVKWLINEEEILDTYGVSICGLQIDRSFYKRLKATEMPENYLPELLGKPNRERYQILLAHNPEYFKEYAHWGADLVLSGHVHGGIVRVPFWGKGVASPNLTLFPEYDGGSFEEQNSRMILSRGLGTHTIPIRLYNPGELVVIDFKGTEER